MISFVDQERLATFPQGGLTYVSILSHDFWRANVFAMSCAKILATVHRRGELSVEGRGLSCELWRGSDRGVLCGGVGSLWKSNPSQLPH